MKRVSKKRAKLLRVAGPQRSANLDGKTCIVCRQKPATANHEIARGPAREACLTEWLLIMETCEDCHRDVQDAPIAEQMAVKVQHIIDYMVERYTELRGQRTVCREDVILRLAMPNFPKVKK